MEDQEVSRCADPGAALIAPTPRYFPTAKLALLAFDVLCVAAVKVMLWVGWASDYDLMLGHILPVVCSAIAFAFAAYGCGLYDDHRLHSVRTAIAPAAMAAAAAASTAIAVGEMLPSASWLAHVVASALAVGCIVGSRALRAAAVEQGFIGPRCVVIGSPEQARRVVDLVARYPHAAISMVGVVQPDSQRRPQPLVDDLPVLGTTSSLAEIARAHGANLVVLASPVAAEDPALLRTLRALRYTGVDVTDFTGLHEELAREIPLDHVNEAWLFLASTSSSRAHLRYVKRAMDVAGAALLLVPGSLVLAVAALAIKLTSKGPVVFRQERLGLGSRPFMVLKLRTMYEDAEKRGAMWSTDKDPRITPVGRVLRKFRIDELPQLVNVLRGDMSLIGPRPERAVFADKIVAEVPLFHERLMVRPGITGWAQVMAPYAASIEDSQRKLQFDLYYAKHMSPGLDILIAAKTVKTMVFGREREQGGLVAGRQLAGASAVAESSPRSEIRA